MNIVSDVLVIGSGAGGATVASALAERGLEVVLVEEGKFYPANDVPQTATSSMLGMWRSSGLTPAFGNPPIAYAEGRCVGGGTEINSAIFQRAPKEILNEWDSQIKDFNATSLEKYYNWAEKTVNASLTQQPLGPVSDRLHNAGRSQGWKTEELPRGQKTCVATNLCAFGCPTGAKQSMTQTLIPKFLKFGGNLMSETKISRLVSDGTKVKKAYGIQISKGKQHKITFSAKYFFVACGTVHSAHLLQRSALKSTSQSRFQLHPTVKVVARFSDEID